MGIAVKNDPDEVKHADDVAFANTRNNVSRCVVRYGGWKNRSYFQ